MTRNPATDTGCSWLARLLFQSVPGFPFGPYQVWPFAQVLAESLLTGGFPNGISSGSIIGTPALSQALESNQGVELLRWKASLNEAHMLFLMN